jgi:D-methionine transport system ATP-binding protein
VISIQHLSKVYPNSSEHALKDINLEIATGDVFGVIGISGAGKSTLVRCINALEHPTSGKVLVDGVDVTTLKGADLRHLRQHVAMIFQGFGLLAQKTALDNVCFPFLAAKGRVSAGDRERARELLAMVGLAEKEQSYPSQLSGGQKQRVAIARALALEPDHILCDEATSALDPASTVSVLDVLQRINQETGVTIVIITHSMDVVERVCKNVAVLERGHLVEQGSVAQVFADPQATTTKALLGKVSWNG